MDCFELFNLYIINKTYYPILIFDHGLNLPLLHLYNEIMNLHQVSRQEKNKQDSTSYFNINFFEKFQTL
jgi:hypothetical protein